MNNYITETTQKYLRTAIAKVILGSHSFMVERGLWVSLKIEFGER